MGASGLGPLLVKEGLLTEQDRRTITKTCGQSSWAFAKCILAMGTLDEDELAAFLADKTRYQVAPRNLLDLIDPKILEYVDPRMIARLEVLPLKVDWEKVQVAVVDPLDKGTIRQIEFFTGLGVDPIIAPISQIYRGLSRLVSDFIPQFTALSTFLQNHAGSAWQKQRIEEEGLLPALDENETNPRGSAKSRPNDKYNTVDEDLDDFPVDAVESVTDEDLDINHSDTSEDFEFSMDEVAQNPHQTAFGDQPENEDLPEGNQESKDAIDSLDFDLHETTSDKSFLSELEDTSEFGLSDEDFSKLDDRSLTDESATKLSHPNHLVKEESVKPQPTDLEDETLDLDLEAEESIGTDISNEDDENFETQSLLENKSDENSEFSVGQAQSKSSLDDLDDEQFESPEIDTLKRGLTAKEPHEEIGNSDVSKSSESDPLEHWDETWGTDLDFNPSIDDKSLTNTKERSNKDQIESFEIDSPISADFDLFEEDPPSRDLKTSPSKKLEQMDQEGSIVDDLPSQTTTPAKDDTVESALHHDKKRDQSIEQSIETDEFGFDDLGDGGQIPNLRPNKFTDEPVIDEDLFQDDTKVEPEAKLPIHSLVAPQEPIVELSAPQLTPSIANEFPRKGATGSPHSSAIATLNQAILRLSLTNDQDKALTITASTLASIIPIGAILNMNGKKPQLIRSWNQRASTLPDNNRLLKLIEPMFVHLKLQDRKYLIPSWIDTTHKVKDWFTGETTKIYLFENQKKHLLIFIGEFERGTSLEIDTSAASLLHQLGRRLDFD